MLITEVIEAFCSAYLKTGFSVPFRIQFYNFAAVIPYSQDK